MFVNRPEISRPLDELLRKLDEEEWFRAQRIDIGGTVRVEVREDGSYFYTDGNYASVLYPANEVPNWIRDSVNALRVVDAMDKVQGVGVRYNDTVFYLDVQEHDDGR
jgi:hypothetical protein